MISKEKREKDRAICEAATKPLPWEVESDSSDDVPEFGSAPTWPFRITAGQNVIVDFTGGHDTTEEDAEAIVNAVSRLPAYIDAAEEMERRIEKIERAMKAQESGERAGGDRGRASDGLREALKILRGES